MDASRKITFGDPVAHPWDVKTNSIILNSYLNIVK
jgi:hypothetical protein